MSAEGEEVNRRSKFQTNIKQFRFFLTPSRKQIEGLAISSTLSLIGLLYLIQL
jgi:hypothetical protein